MVKIKREIDLRSKDFIASRRLIKPACVKYFVIVFSICFLVGVWTGVPGYMDWMRLKTENDLESLLLLREEVAPLQEMSNQVALLEARSRLEQELDLSAEPIHEHVLAVKHEAKDHNLKIETIAADISGNFYFKGRSKDIKTLVLFNQSFENRPFTCSANIKSIVLDRGGEYSFEIVGSTKSQVGGDLD